MEIETPLNSGSISVKFIEGSAFKKEVEHKVNESIKKSKRIIIFYLFLILLKRVLNTILNVL